MPARLVHPAGILQLYLFNGIPGELPSLRWSAAARAGYGGRESLSLSGRPFSGGPHRQMAGEAAKPEDSL